MKPVLLAGLPLLLAACQGLEPPQATQSAAVASPALALAQQRCGTCHAVERVGHSPNPNAPPFRAIVNQEGLTGETLSTWLRSAHNYPREMDFQLSEAEMDVIAGHMLTLRDPNYRRPSD